MKRSTRGTLMAVLAALCALLLVGPALALEEELSEYEYEPGEGLHEEEWYDPSDWFDTGAGVDFESDDWWDYGYGYNAYDYGLYNDEPGIGNNEYYGYSPFYGNYGYGTAYDDYGVIGTEDYYTDEWYEDEGVFEGWWEDNQGQSQDRPMNQNQNMNQ